MARLVFPSSGERLVYRVNSGTVTAALATSVTVYSDSAATVLADLQTYPDGLVIAGSVVVTDSFGQLPLFYGPADGTDTLYVRITGGPITALYAREDDRLDALSSGKLDVTAASATYVALGSARIDLCQAPYNATPGSDITSALQSAINTVNNVNGGVDIFFSKPGQYLINGAQQTGTAQTYNYSGQILFPAFNYSATPRPVIRIGGIVPNGVHASNLSYSQVVLLSNATSGNVFDVVPGATINGFPTSGINVHFHDIAVQVPNNPQCGGVNLLCANAANIERLVVASTSYSTNPTALTGSGVGLTMPGHDTDGQTVRDTWIEGMPVGFAPSDHCVMVGDNQIWACNTGISLNGAGNPVHLQVYVGGCATGIISTTRATMLSGEVQFECASGQGFTSLAISDTGNFLTGELKVYLNSGAPNAPLPCVFGNTPKLNLRYLVNGLDWLSRHPQDTFTRHAAAATTGSAVPGVCDVTLTPWLVTSGSWNIATQGRLQAAVNTGASANIVTKNNGIARLVSMNITLGSTYNFFLIAQQVGANKLLLHLANSNLTLTGATAGQQQALGALSPSTSYTVGLAVYYSAAGVPDRVKVLQNGVVVLDQAITAAQQTALTPTGGVIVYDGINSNGDQLSYLTNFTVSDLPVGIDTDTATASLTGTTAGTAVSEMPYQGMNYKKALVFLNGYENTTVTAQTITFPTPFVNTPFLAHDDSGGSTVSATTLTLPASMGTTKTGWIVVEGY